MARLNSDQFRFDQTEPGGGLDVSNIHDQDQNWQEMGSANEVLFDKFHKLRFLLMKIIYFDIF